MLYIQFLISSCLIVAGGIRLTKQADALSDHLQLGKVWIGMVLLGMVTSLPEAITSLTAVISLHAKDLAIGNMVGSNNFNLMLIVLMDAVYRQGSVTNKIGYNRANVIPAVFAMLLAFIVLGEIYLVSKGFLLKVGHVSSGSLLILGFYVLGITLSKQSIRQDHVIVSHAEESSGKSALLIRIYCELILSSVVVVVSAIWLTNISEAIAQISGLGRTFVGTVFLAFATSLPEMVVTLSALKIGVLGLAIGNIFGSNIINILILFLCDLCYRQGFLFDSVSPMHMMTAGLSIVLTLIVIGGLKNNTKRTFWRFGWDSYLLLLFFGCGLTVLYHFK